MEKVTSVSRYWMAVLNNPEMPLEEFLQMFIDGGATYAVGQLEAGE